MELPVTRPVSPDLVPVMELHRNGDGFVSFHRKGSRWEDICSVRARDLLRMFPAFAAELFRDAYFSVNSFHRHAGGGGGPGGGLYRVHRSAESVRDLTSCFVDIDCHALGISTGQAVGAVWDAAAVGALPAPSMYVFSGQGVWVFWILRGESGGLQRGWPDKLQLWAQVQHAACSRLASLGADWNAKDAARVTRIPGSLNSKASLRVAYYLAVGPDGKRVEYTLRELAAVFGVEERRLLPGTEAKNRELQQRGATGAAARWRYDVDRFRILWACRGSFPVGQRHNAVMVWTQILSSLRGADALDVGTIEGEVHSLWKTLPQPEAERYPWADALRLIHKAAASRGKGQKRRPLRHQTIANLLKITAEESRICRWPAADAAGGQRRMTRTEEQRLRRRLLEGWTREGVPPLRELCARLEEEAGLSCQPNTVARDLAELGRENPRGEAAKAKRARAINQGQQSLNLE